MPSIHEVVSIGEFHWTKKGRRRKVVLNPQKIACGSWVVGSDGRYLEVAELKIGRTLVEISRYEWNFDDFDRLYTSVVVGRAINKDPKLNKVIRFVE